MKPYLTLFTLACLIWGCEYVESDLPPEALSETELPEGYCGSLVGSWEMISMNVSTPDTSYTINEIEQPTLKVLNGSHWMFIRQSADEFVFAQGGRYALEEGKYTEIVEYSAEPGNISQEYAFECSLEGDSLWYHKGDLGSMFVDEVWRRVEGNPTPM